MDVSDLLKEPGGLEGRIKRALDEDDEYTASELLKYTRNKDIISEYVYYRSKYPVPEVEDIIATDAKMSLEYAQWTLRNRFIKGEKAILESGDEDIITEYIEFLAKREKLEWFLKSYPAYEIKKVIEALLKKIKD